MKKIFIKIISLVMLMSMCCSMMCISAMAETTTNTTKDAEGNTVITETTVDSYLAAEGDNPAVSGEITTLEITVTSPDGQLISESGSKTGTVVTVTENEGKPETSTGGPKVGDPVISDVSGSQLEVKFEDENGNLQFGTQTDSVTPEVKPAEDDYNNIDENTGLGSSQVTSVDGKETTVVTTEKTQSSTSSGPVVTTPEEGLTRTEVTETTTTVEAVTTQTVVVTDRELIANLGEGAEASSSSEVSKELNGDAVEGLNDLLTNMGVIDEALAPEVAEKVLEGLASGTAPSDENAKEVVDELLNADDAKVTEDESAIEETKAPSIVVSKVDFVVGENVEGDVYKTEIDFTVVVATDVAGTTTVTVFNGSEIIASESIETGNGEHSFTLENLNLSEGVNYNLQFDFAATKDLGTDTYIYQASIETPANAAQPESGYSGFVPTVDNEMPKEADKQAHIQHLNKHGLDLPKGDKYSLVLIGKDGEDILIPAQVRGTTINADMSQFETNELPIKHGEQCQLLLIDEHGNLYEMTAEWQENDKNPNGLNNFMLISAAQLVNKEKYEYEYSYEKTQQLAASDNVVLSFNVTEATVETESSSVTTTTVDTKTTVTDEWNKEWNNKYEIEKPEDPKKPEKPNPPQPVPSNDEVEVIEEELVPLAKAPQTGSISAIFAVAAAFSGLGLAGLAFSAKRKED